MQEEWNSIAFGTDMREKRRVVRPRSKDKKIKRLKHGLRTTQKSYYGPILGALTTMGGKGPAKEVLKLVERSMRSTFNQYDLEYLPSNNMPRWEKTANWARKDMVNLGLLSSNSERGIWEITGKGKNWLAEKK